MTAGVDGNLPGSAFRPCSSDRRSLAVRQGRRFSLSSSVSPEGLCAETRTRKKDALEIGIPAAGGAVVGGILGGKQGAAIGGLAAGGAGTAYVLSTRGKEVRLGRGAALSVRLADPLAVRCGRQGKGDLYPTSGRDARKRHGKVRV